MPSAYRKEFVVAIVVVHVRLQILAIAIAIVVVAVVVVLIVIIITILIVAPVGNLSGILGAAEMNLEIIYTNA